MPASNDHIQAREGIAAGGEGGTIMGVDIWELFKRISIPTKALLATNTSPHQLSSWRMVRNAAFHIF